MYYKVYESNRKAKENEQLENEDEAKKFKILLCMQMKPIITLLLVGGIDVIGNVLISFAYTLIKVSTEPNTIFYLEQVLMYLIIVSLLINHPLVYGLMYIKKIRGRLPICVSCPNLCTTHRSRVVTLHQQY